MNEKRLSSLKLAIINVNYITSSWSETIFKFLFDRISWLFFFWYLHLPYIKKTTSFHAPLCQSVSQSVNLYIHQPTANHVSRYIMTSFYSCLIPDSFLGRTIFLQSYQYQMQQEHLYTKSALTKRRTVKQTKLYPILKTIIHFIHLSVSERYFLLQNHWHQF